MALNIMTKMEMNEIIESINNENSKVFCRFPVLEINLQIELLMS